MSPGNPFIFRLKGQGHEAQKQCRREFLYSCGCWLVWNSFRYGCCTIADYDIIFTEVYWPCWHWHAMQKNSK